MGMTTSEIEETFAHLDGPSFCCATHWVVADAHLGLSSQKTALMRGEQASEHHHHGEMVLGVGNSKDDPF